MRPALQIGSPRHLCRLLVALHVLAVSGCLSIGGRTINENPETEARLDGLESRVSHLEQSTGARPPLR